MRVDIYLAGQINLSPLAVKPGIPACAAHGRDPREAFVRNQLQVKLHAKQ
jgi:hypothetical protein